jgi:hypothetical protein
MVAPAMVAAQPQNLESSQFSNEGHYILSQQRFVQQPVLYRLTAMFRTNVSTAARSAIVFPRGIESLPLLHSCTSRPI